MGKSGFTGHVTWAGSPSQQEAELGFGLRSILAELLQAQGSRVYPGTWLIRWPRAHPHQSPGHGVGVHSPGVSWEQSPPVSSLPAQHLASPHPLSPPLWWWILWHCSQPRHCPPGGPGWFTGAVWSNFNMQPTILADLFQRKRPLNQNNTLFKTNLRLSNSAIVLFW